MMDISYHPKVLTVGATVEFSVELPEAKSGAGSPRVFLHPFEDQACDAHGCDVNNL